MTNGYLKAILNLKKYLITLLFTLSIFGFYYLFQYLNHGFHPLNKDDYSVKIFQLNSNNAWEKYKHKDVNDSQISDDKKSIKSVLKFKQNGILLLKFSFIEKSIHKTISYQIKKNKQAVDIFMLNKDEKHKCSLKVNKGDTLEVFVDSYEKKPYWGKLKTSFNTFSFSSFNVSIPFLWMTFFLFLFYKGFGYLASLSYFMFGLILYSEYLNFGIVSSNIAFTYTFFLFTISLMFLWIYQLFAKFKNFRLSFILILLLTLLLSTVPLIFLMYALNFEHELTKESLYAIFQSNSNESSEYIEKFISLKYIVLLGVIVTLMAFLIYKQEQKVVEKVESSVLFFIITIFMTISFTRFSDYRLGNFFYESVEKYTKELSLFKEAQAKRKTGELNFIATKDAKDETYVVVIGESLNKNHMGLYGYMRDTTPKLSSINEEGELIVFSNTYSNHTHTVPVLSLSLTEANQYNSKSYYNSLSIIEILNKANIETHWLTNQTIYGEWDNMVSVLATTAKNVVTLNSSIGYTINSQQFDVGLLEKIQKVLAIKTDTTRVIFVHLLGNHSTYASRYPKDKFSTYTEDLKESQFGISISTKQEMNHYDNSVKYNDFVVSEILKEVQKQKGITGFIYMSDHSEDINKNFGHSKDFFTYEMTEIPFLGWFSSEYQKKYSTQYNNFVNNKNRLFSNDMLYATLLGLIDVKTDKYESKYDLSSHDYNLIEEDALVMHGKRKYIEKENHLYWQKKNIKYLHQSNLTLRVFPSNVNTLGKLNEVLNSGFQTLEIEINCNNENMLNEFLERIDFNEVKLLLVKYKNLTQHNYLKVLKNLNFLNKKYKVKNKLLLKLDKNTIIYKKFILDGWLCSLQSQYIKEDNLLLSDIDFQGKLLKNENFQNQIVKGVLVEYLSPFEGK